MSEIFEKILKESLKNKIPSLNLEITDEQFFEKAFEFIVDAVKLMTQLFTEINDINSYKSLFESVNENYEKEINSTMNNIRGCGDIIKQVCGMVYEYLHSGTVYDNYEIQKKDFCLQNALNIVNNQIHIAQTVIKGYNGEFSIEIACQVYDLTVDEFNGSIDAINQQRNLNIPKAENPNLFYMLRNILIK